MMAILETSGLTKLYGNRVGLEDLDLSIEEGSICGFLGPNGAGKSTAIRLLLGFLRPTRGRARIFGRDSWHEGRFLREEVGYLPGDLRLYPWLTVRRALRLFGRIRRRVLEPAGFEMAADFGLDPDVPASSMSRGMRQMLGLILALAPAPRLLILDEPTAALDPVIQEKLKRRLLALAARGHTVFFSSHSLSEVERLCERVVILRSGRAVADSLLEDLRARARRRIQLRWRSPGEASRVEPPPGLEDLEREGPTWRGIIHGPVQPHLRWLAAQAIEDVVIGQPDMEAVFQDYYRDPEKPQGKTP